MAEPLRGFIDANQARSRLAAQRDIAIARGALAAWPASWPESWRRVAILRVHHPKASWRHIADLANMTKDEAASSFRRLRVAVREGRDG